jgi:hypothetical protein
VTQEQRERLNRAISEKRNEWWSKGADPDSWRPMPWCTQWIYAGRLLEDLVGIEGEARLLHPSYVLMTPLEQIAGKWAKLNGIKEWE